MIWYNIIYFGFIIIDYIIILYYINIILILTYIQLYFSQMDGFIVFHIWMIQCTPGGSWDASPRRILRPFHPAGKRFPLGMGRSFKWDLNKEEYTHISKMIQTYQSIIRCGTSARHVLDFDFEKLCSMTLSGDNVYCDLVDGKFFQGRGKDTPAYRSGLRFVISNHLGYTSSKWPLI